MVLNDVIKRDIVEVRLVIWDNVNDIEIGKEK